MLGTLGTEDGPMDGAAQGQSSQTFVALGGCILVLLHLLAF